ncbi:lipoyl(octanoyl) transferase LipB [Oceanicoccus sagamiensis]|uniref:Octanoyltransferase n=1 Tax=Oceanicoccus sagamiensis TaxID=716816 RepID=A0A1X9NGQ4_9GAMM|nr:lipoyl(octanoyl) transferase LipB [Oceanicoccus sagamiensis]ARN74689.1 octanoyltransferase [Oceanicoccus sagamiensis]
MLIVRDLGLADYEPVWQAMQHFTDTRDPDTPDEIWCLEHPAVFTQGQAGKAEHLLAPGNIPVIQVDRGGQVTYHGPGQLVAYLLIDLRRKDMGVRNLVTAIEAAIVKVLAHYQIKAAPRADAPGVYIQTPDGEAGAKIAQLGLRVRKGCSFHGLSINRDMDIEPFQRINPCGYAGMAVSSMHLETPNPPSYSALSTQLIEQLASDLGYTERQQISDGQLPG